MAAGTRDLRPRMRVAALALTAALGMAVPEASAQEFEAILAEHGTLRTIVGRHPTLGRLVENIRTGNTSVPPKHMDWLRANGFRWSCTNVAKHVAGYLGMERSNLPADATLNEAVMHCLHEGARMELFGTLTVPELVGRYNEHRARL